MGMKILIAEDEESIAEAYRLALEFRGHEVTMAQDGAQCIERYTAVCSASENRDAPFDVAILDYRMPKMNGLDVAKEILKLRPNQRIIFASAYVRETVVESVKQLRMVVELLQKPFELDVLVDTVEDKSIYEELKKLNVDIKRIKNWKPTHTQVRDLLDGLLRLRDPKVDFRTILSANNRTASTSGMSNNARR